MDMENGLNSPTVRGTAKGSLGLATMGFFGGFSGVALFGPMVPRFVHIMHLSPIQAGFLAAIASLTGSLLRIPFGAWADKSGGKKAFLTLLVLALIGMAGLITLLRIGYPNHLTGTYPLLLLLGMFVGSGIATFSVGIPQVSYWFPKQRQGGPLGIYGGLGNMGSGIFSLILPLAVVGLGLVAAYEVWFGFLLVVTIIYATGMHDAPSFQLKAQNQPVDADVLSRYGQDLLPRGSAKEALAQAARSPATWALTILYFTSFGGFLALIAWLPSYWHGIFRLHAVTGGALTLTFALLASLIRVPGGLMADRLPIKHALNVNVLIIFLGTLMVIFSNQVAAALFGTIVISIGMGLQNAVVFKLVPRYIPDAVGGTAGWVGGLGAFGGFVLPPVMGAIAGIIPGATGYAAGFYAFVALAIINWVTIAWLHRSDSRREVSTAA